jgi:hypothetical protein
MALTPTSTSFPCHGHTVDLPEAFGQGLFANQNSACKLRHELTLTEVSKAFHLENKA